jgi:integrase
MERCKPSTQGEYRREINQFINPAIGSFKIVDVERKDIADLHHKFRDKPYQANRTLGVLSKMFNLSEIWCMRPDGSNPRRHVPKYREVKRERYVSQHELQRLGQVLAQVERDKSVTVFVVAAFRLLILIGCRLGEIQTLRWDYVTPNAWNCPTAKLARGAFLCRSQPVMYWHPCPERRAIPM